MKTDIDQLILLHSQGLLDKEIGNKLGVCSDAIFYHRKRLGLKANGPTKGSLIIDAKGRRKCSKCKKFRKTNMFASDGRGSIRRQCLICRKEYRDEMYVDSKSSLEKAILHRCRYWRARAKKENISYEIDYKYVMELLHKQDRKCFYSDREMMLDGTRENHDNSLSIDRIVPETGYVKGNIVFCIQKINLCKNNLSLEEIQKWMPVWYSRIETFLQEQR